VLGDEVLRQSSNHWSEQHVEVPLCINFKQLTITVRSKEWVCIHNCLQTEFPVVWSLTRNILENCVDKFILTFFLRHTVEDDLLELASS